MLAAVSRLGYYPQDPSQGSSGERELGFPAEGATRPETLRQKNGDA